MMRGDESIVPLFHDILEGLPGALVMLITCYLVITSETVKFRQRLDDRSQPPHFLAFPRNLSMKEK
jgi:hypothetical protein